jgi:hypothetical protein
MVLFALGFCGTGGAASLGGGPPREKMLLNVPRLFLLGSTLVADRRGVDAVLLAGDATAATLVLMRT